MPYGRARDVGAAHRACTLLAPDRVDIESCHQYLPNLRAMDYFSRTHRQRKLYASRLRL
jgi:hypothetical protein